MKNEKDCLSAIDMHKAGVSIKEIARRFHRSVVTIRSWFVENNYDFLARQKVLKEKDKNALREKVLQLYPVMGLQEIADTLGEKYSTVENSIIGFKTRSRSEERDLNAEYRARREKAEGLVICACCGQRVKSLDSIGLCSVCNGTDDSVTEHQAWLEFEEGWAERRGNIGTHNRKSQLPVLHL